MELSRCTILYSTHVLSPLNNNNNSNNTRVPYMYKADWGPLTAYTISTCLNDMVDNQCTYLSSFFSHNQGGSSSPSSGGARVYAQTRRTISLRPSTRPRPAPRDA